MTMDICNLSTQEVETRGLLKIEGQFGLRYEILSQTKAEIKLCKRQYLL